MPLIHSLASARTRLPNFVTAALDTSRGLCYNVSMKTSDNKPSHLSASGISSWIDKNGVPNLNFAWAERHYGSMTDDALMWNINDCRESVLANPDNLKNGLYEDTIHVINGILLRRKKNKQ